MGIAFFAPDELLDFSVEVLPTFKDGKARRKDGSENLRFSMMDTLEMLERPRDEVLKGLKDRDGCTFEEAGMTFDDLQRIGWQALAEGLDPVKYAQELQIPGLQREEFYIRQKEEMDWEWDDPIAMEITQAAREYIAKHEGK